MRNRYQELNSEDENDVPNKPVRHQNISVVGAEGVGKTQLVYSLIGTEYFDDEYHPTIGATQVSMRQGNVSLLFFDCSGAERFQQFMPQYTRNSDQVLLVFDVHNKQSLEALITYIDVVREYAPKAKLILVGILKDFYIDRVITPDIAADFAAKYDLNAYFEIWTVSSEGTQKLRNHLLQSETPDLTPHEEQLLVSKQSVSEKITIFKEKAVLETQPAVKEAMLVIANYLELGLHAENANNYFFNAEEVLKGQLNALQYSSASLYSSALNILALTFAFCSVVGIVALWLSGLLENNEKNKGNPFLFVDKGPKQQAEEIIHQTVDLFKKKQ